MIFVFEPINDKFTKFVECGRVRVKVQVAQKIYIYIYIYIAGTNCIRYSNYAGRGQAQYLISYIQAV